MSELDSSAVSAIVDSELQSYVHVEPKEGSTYGVPWSEARVRQCLAERRAKMSSPYLSPLRVLDSDRRPGVPDFSANVWVIWKDGDQLVFFDPKTGNYGLAALQADSETPMFWGVYGDAVYVLCAV